MGRYKLRPRRFIPAVALLFCALAVTLWGVWYGAAWAKSAVLARLLDVRLLAREEIVKTTPVEGVLIRREETVKAPAPGKLRLLARDGERLRVGAPLAEIQGVSSHKVWSPGAGVFCTHLDGLEGLLVPGMIDVLDMGAVERISNNREVAGGGEVTGGELIGKLVDNLQPVLIYIKLDNPGDDAARLWKKGTAVHLLCNGRELTGGITEVRGGGDGLGMFIEVEKYPESFVHERYQRLELVTRRVAGWLVPERALVFKDGKPGIYVVSKQILRWMPVTARDNVDGKVAISGEGLSEALRYVSNPAWAREGARLDD